MVRSAVNRVALQPTSYSINFAEAGADRLVHNIFAYDPAGSNWAVCMSYMACKLPLGGINDYNLYSQMDGTGTGRSWLYVDRNNNKFSTYLNNTTQNYNTTVTLNVWYRLCLTRDNATGAVVLYVNGVSDGSNSPTIVSANGFHVIGNNKISTGGLGGLITNVSFYNRTFSASDALNENRQGGAGATGLQYKLLMSEGSGPTVSDSSGNLQNCTITTATWDSRTQWKTRNLATRTAVSAYRIPVELRDFGLTSYYDWREGKVGEGKSSARDYTISGRDLAYRGTTPSANIWTAGEYSVDLEASATDYLKENAPKRVNSGSTFGSLTVFCWFKKEGDGVAGELMARWRASGPGRSWQLRITSGNILSFFASTNGTATALQINGTSAVTGTAWNFVTITNQQSSATIKLYLNGSTSPFSFVTGSGGVTVFDSEVETWIGALPDASNNPTIPFDGKIGICGFCKGTFLTDAQVLRLYELTKSLGGY